MLPKGFSQVRVVKIYERYWSVIKTEMLATLGNEVTTSSISMQNMHTSRLFDRFVDFLLKTVDD